MKSGAIYKISHVRIDYNFKALYADNIFSLSMSHLMGVNASNFNDSVLKYPTDANMRSLHM